jgi:hypothetical protein
MRPAVFAEGTTSRLAGLILQSSILNLKSLSVVTTRSGYEE